MITHELSEIVDIFEGTQVLNNLIELFKKKKEKKRGPFTNLAVSEALLYISPTKIGLNFH